MRALLHLTAVVLALPGILLAAGFLALGQAIAAKTLPGFFGVLLELFVWLVPWGLVGSVLALLALVLAGFSARLRPFAAACVALLAIASSVVLLVLATSHGNFAPGQLAFFVPALAAMAISAWLAASEWRATRTPTRHPGEAH